MIQITRLNSTANAPFAPVVRHEKKNRICSAFSRINKYRIVSSLLIHCGNISCALTWRYNVTNLGWCWTSPAIIQTATLACGQSGNTSSIYQFTHWWPPLGDTCTWRVYLIIIHVSPILTLTLIPACISNHIQYKMWDEITYPFP